MSQDTIRYNNSSVYHSHDYYFILDSGSSSAGVVISDLRFDDYQQFQGRARFYNYSDSVVIDSMPFTRRYPRGDLGEFVSEAISLSRVVLYKYSEGQYLCAVRKRKWKDKFAKRSFRVVGSITLP